MSVYINIDLLFDLIEDRVFSIAVFPRRDAIQLRYRIGTVNYSVWGIVEGCNITIENVSLWIDNNDLVIRGSVEYIRKFVVAHNIKIDQEKLADIQDELEDEINILDYFCEKK